MERGGKPPLLSTVVGKRVFEYPLEYIIFGSISSVDYDLIIKVPVELVEAADGAHVFMQMCLVIDKYMESILYVGNNPHKPINSSLGYWENGQMLWCQKGSSTAEVNNGIIATFDNHLSFQMFPSCPLIHVQERNVWDKLLTTTRDTLCKLNHCSIEFQSLDEEVEWIASLAHYILNIPEVRSRPISFVHGFLSGYHIPSDLFSQLPHRHLITEIEVTSLKKKARLKELERIYLDPTNKTFILDIIRQNRIHRDHIDFIVSQLLKEQANNVDLINGLKEATKSGLVTLRRLIHQSRKIRELGPRLDILRIIDFARVKVIEPDEKYKTIVFKVCQALQLVKGREVFSKEELIDLYPTMRPFLTRRPPSHDDLKNLNALIQNFVEVVMSYPDYQRDLVEIMRN